MKNEIKKGISEYRNKNYKKALRHFDKVSTETNEYAHVLVYKVSCLMALKRYREALKILNVLIKREPHEDVWQIEKTWCLVFLKEYDEAGVSLRKLEDIVDVKNKKNLLQVAKLYNVLGNDVKVMEYADKALEIDENYQDALLEKVTVLGRTHDRQEIDKVSDKLLEISDKKLLSIMPIFLLKLFSDDYQGAFDLLNKCEDDEIDEGHIELLKSSIYNRMVENLNVSIYTSREIELTVEEVLDLMLDYHKSGTDSGQIHGVQYSIY